MQDRYDATKTPCMMLPVVNHQRRYPDGDKLSVVLYVKEIRN